MLITSANFVESGYSLILFCLYICLSSYNHIKDGWSYGKKLSWVKRNRPHDQRKAQHIYEELIRNSVVVGDSEYVRVGQCHSKVIRSKLGQTGCNKLAEWSVCSLV